MKLSISMDERKLRERPNRKWQFETVASAVGAAAARAQLSPEETSQLATTGATRDGKVALLMDSGAPFKRND